MVDKLIGISLVAAVMVFILGIILLAISEDDKGIYIKENIKIGKVFRESKYAEPVRLTREYQEYKISSGPLGLKPVKFIVRNDTIIEVWRDYSLP